MKAVIRTSVIAAIILFAASALVAQEWTKAQKEVWQVVEDSWAKTKTWDIDGLMASIHEKYQGWNESAPLPMNKEQVGEFYKMMKETMKMPSWPNASSSGSISIPPTLRWVGRWTSVLRACGTLSWGLEERWTAL
jgi:hypothetical protein